MLLPFTIAVLLSTCLSTINALISSTTISDNHHKNLVIFIDGNTIEVERYADITLCTIDMGPGNYVNGEIKASAMGNGKIVVWGVKSLDFTSEGTKTDHIFIIVDIATCTAVSKTLTDLTPLNWPMTDFISSVITYKDTFHVFLPSQTECAPCRFDDKMDKIPSIPDGVFGKSMIEAFLEPNYEVNGYFYVSDSENGQARIKVLSKNFETLKERRIDHHVTAIATNSIGMRMGLCYQESELEYYCERLDEDLKPMFKTRLPINPNQNAKFRVKIDDLKIDEQGVFYVTVHLKKIAPARAELIVYRLNNETGNVDQAADFVSVRGIISSVKSFREDEDHFCLSTTRENRIPQKPDYEIKCRLIET